MKKLWSKLGKNAKQLIVMLAAAALVFGVVMLVRALKPKNGELYKPDFKNGFEAYYFSILESDFTDIDPSEYPSALRKLGEAKAAFKPVNDDETSQKMYELCLGLTSLGDKTPQSPEETAESIMRHYRQATLISEGKSFAILLHTEKYVYCICDVTDVYGLGSPVLSVARWDSETFETLKESFRYSTVRNKHESEIPRLLENEFFWKAYDVIFAALSTMPEETYEELKALALAQYTPSDKYAPSDKYVHLVDEALEPDKQIALDTVSLDEILRPEENENGFYEDGALLLIYSKNGRSFIIRFSFFTDLDPDRVNDPQYDYSYTGRIRYYETGPIDESFFEGGTVPLVRGVENVCSPEVMGKTAGGMVYSLSNSGCTVSRDGCAGLWQQGDGVCFGMIKMRWDTPEGETAQPEFFICPKEISENTPQYVRDHFDKEFLVSCFAVCFDLRGSDENWFYPYGDASLPDGWEKYTLDGKTLEY